MSLSVAVTPSSTTILQRLAAAAGGRPPVIIDTRGRRLHGPENPVRGFGAGGGRCTYVVYEITAPGTGEPPHQIASLSSGAYPNVKVSVDVSLESGGVLLTERGDPGTGYDMVADLVGTHCLYVGFPLHGFQMQIGDDGVLAPPFPTGGPGGLNWRFVPDDDLSISLLSPALRGEAVAAAVWDEVHDAAQVAAVTAEFKAVSGVLTSPLFGGPPAVQIDIDGLAVGVDAHVTVHRSWAGQTAPVRSGVRVPVTGEALRIVDYEAPFTTMTYSVTVTDSAGGITSQTSSVAVALESDVPWISDPLNPAAAAPIRFHADALSALSLQQPGTASQPIGARLPVSATGPRLAAADIPLDINCRSRAERDAALAVLNSAGVVCLRCPSRPAYSPLPPLAYIQADTVIDRPLTIRQGGQQSRIDWTGTLVRAPATPLVVPIRTYADLLDEANTYASLAARYPDYLTVAAGG